MTVLELSRWQFGITTVYHFIYVPLTLSLSYLIAGMLARSAAAAGWRCSRSPAPCWPAPRSTRISW